MIVVSDSTPLIHLSAIGRLDLLRDLCGQIHIAPEVYGEVVVQGAGQHGAAAVQAAAWINTTPITDVQAFSQLCSVMGVGESASIVLAADIGADLLILDDRQARSQAEAKGIMVIGTVGILLQAARRYGLEFQQILDDHLATGFRLSKNEYQRALLLWQKPSTP